MASEDGAFRPEPVWTYRRMRNHFNNSVAVDRFLYGFDNATPRCLDTATGEPRWAERGSGKGALVACGDLLFVLGDQGILALVRATPDAYRELGRVQAMQGRSWTSPTLASNDGVRSPTRGDDRRDGDARSGAPRGLLPPPRPRGGRLNATGRPRPRRRQRREPRVASRSGIV